MLLKKKRKVKRKIKYRKCRVTSRKRKKQRGGFFNHYDFGYAGRDVVNQATKVPSGVIKNVTNDIEKRINQIISKGGAEMERVLPKILSGAIEYVFQTLFRLLAKFRKQLFSKIKPKNITLKSSIFCIFYLQI